MLPQISASWSSLCPSYCLHSDFLLGLKGTSCQSSLSPALSSPRSAPTPSAVSFTRRLQSESASHPLHRTSLPSHRPGIPTNSWKAPSLLLAFIQQMVICNYEHFIGHTVVFLVFPELSPAARTQDTQDHPPAFMTSVYLDGSTTFPLSRLKVTPTPLSSSHINNRQILWI